MSTTVRPSGGQCGGSSSRTSPAAGVARDARRPPVFAGRVRGGGGARGGGPGRRPGAGGGDPSVRGGSSAEDVAARSSLLFWDATPAARHHAPSLASRKAREAVPEGHGPRFPAWRRTSVAPRLPGRRATERAAGRRHGNSGGFRASVHRSFRLGPRPNDERGKERASVLKPSGRWVAARHGLDPAARAIARECQGVHVTRDRPDVPFWGGGGRQRSPPVWAETLPSPKTRASNSTAARGTASAFQWFVASRARRSMFRD